MRYAVGVELFSNHIRLVALDLQVREVGFRVVQRPFRADREYADQLARTIEAFLDETGVPREKLLGVGITVPGIVDGDQASLTGAYTLGIRQLDIGELMSAIPYPVHLVSDANAGGFAECWGWTGVEHMAYLSLSRAWAGPFWSPGWSIWATAAAPGSSDKCASNRVGRRAAASAGAAWRPTAPPPGCPTTWA